VHVEHAPAAERRRDARKQRDHAERGERRDAVFGGDTRPREPAARCHAREGRGERQEEACLLEPGDELRRRRRVARGDCVEHRPRLRQRRQRLGDAARLDAGGEEHQGERQQQRGVRAEARGLRRFRGGSGRSPVGVPHACPPCRLLA
jgi:hypothetical protein